MTHVDKVVDKRVRTFTGCRTCRRRRVKCDEQRPACGHCERLGLDCEGYDALIQWMRPVHTTDFQELTDEDSLILAADGRQSRRQLFSDAQRQKMCDSLAEVARDLDHSELTSMFETECRQDGETVTVGPFGAFSSSNVIVMDIARNSTGEDDEHDTTVSEPKQHHPGSESTHYIAIPDHYQDQDMFAQTVNPLRSPGASRALDFEMPTNIDLGGWPSTPAISFEDIQITGSDQGHISQQFSGHDEVLSSWNEPYGHFLMTDIPSVDNTHNTRLLLNHFMSKFAHQDSIWQLQAVQIQKTLGQIALRLTPSEGNQAILNAVLAVSAYHLDRLTTLEAGDGHWWMVATEYKTKAISNLQAVFGTGSTSLDKAKYKTILMALLTMVNVCLTSGKLEEARTYLLDAQKLIKTSARPERQQSRKVQSLHAFFVYLRVMEEATFIYPICPERSMNNNCTHMYSVTKFPSLAVKDLSQTPRGQPGVDFNRVMIPDWVFEAADGSIKTILAKTLGLPESLLVLMSHTTFIACEARQARNLEKLANPDITEDFNNRVKIVEELLCAWSYPKNGQDLEDTPDTSISGLGMRTFLEHIALAFHSALLLYFYREVKDINRLILQGLVSTITTHLLACENSKQQNNIPSSSVVWPGFMAAVEANNDEEFSCIVGWMRSCADRYALRAFDRAIVAATEVRSLRKSAGVDRWPDIMLQKGIFLVLS